MKLVISELLEEPIPPKVRLKECKYQATGVIGAAMHVALECGVRFTVLGPFCGRFSRAVDESDTPLALISCFCASLEELVVEVKKIQLSGSSVKVRLIDKYLREHFAESLDVSELAATVGLNSSYASTLFKRETGKTISERILQYRVEAAELWLIETEKSVAEIAALVGFPLPNHFAKMFKRITGKSPREFRKKISNI